MDCATDGRFRSADRTAAGHSAQNDEDVVAAAVGYRRCSRGGAGPLLPTACRRRHASRAVEARAGDACAAHSRCGRRAMNRDEEHGFAWALADTAGPLLNPTARHWLCVQLGAGDYRSAILELLERFAAADRELPLALAPSLERWVHGFTGSRYEHRLRTVALRIRLGPPIPESIPAAPPPPLPLVARRPYPAARRIALRSRAVSASVNAQPSSSH